jgi:indolepyruvate decarboxylase
MRAALGGDTGRLIGGRFEADLSSPSSASVAAHLIDALRAHGARAVFGIPGDFALPFFRVLEDRAGLPLYTMSHEPSLGYAADAAARYAGGLGVAAVTYGAGALNLVNAVACAYAEESPLVVISGAPGRDEREDAFLLHHQVRSLDTPMRVFAEVTCAAARLDDPQTAPAVVARVLGRCRDRSRPVYLELPRDMALAPTAPWRDPRPPALSGPEVLERAADAIAARLRDARAPVLLVDAALRRRGAEGAAAELARGLGAPVATTLFGRGLLAGTGVPVSGVYLAGAGDPAIAALVEEADPLLLVGVLRTDTNFRGSAIDFARAIRIDGDAAMLDGKRFEGVPMAPLLDAVAARLAPCPRATSGRPAARAPRFVADGSPLRPDDVAAAVALLFAERGPMPIAADTGDSLFTALGAGDGPVVAPGYYATMGFGVPAGLGLEAVSGERPLILVGDGAFQMTGWELGHCGRHGWKPIVVVLNNGGWQMLRALAPSGRFNDLGSWSFAALAGALGGHGVRVETRGALIAALRAAAERADGFSLIEAMIAPGAMSAVLDRFAARVREGAAASGID